MQITLPEIDNYTLYYETFVFILRVYAIMLFDYVYRCAQSSARAICTRADNYKPANERHAESAEKRRQGKKEDDSRTRAFIGMLLRRYYDRENERERERETVRLRTILGAESIQELIHAWLRLKTESY